MKAEEVLEKYISSEKVLQIADKLKSERNSHVQIKGLAGSSRAFVSAAVAGNIKGLHLFVMQDKEAAAYFLNDMENIIPKSNVLFFPSSYKRPYQVEETDNANILLRAEVLNSILQSSIPNLQSPIIITYSEALSEKVVTKSHLEKNSLKLKRGEKLSLDFVIQLLNEYGFAREDYVIEPGQYSVRGGIVDVFSFANDNPYRIELFGDEVESIRLFDAINQLSIKQVEELSIIPNIEDKLLRENRQSFLEYIPADSFIWIENEEHTKLKISKEFEAAEKAYSLKKEQSIFNHLNPDELFVSQSAYEQQLQKFSQLHFQTNNTSYHSFYFNTSPQPIFKKNFQFLLDNLKLNKEKGIKNFIFSDNPKQSERLNVIFEDLTKNASTLDHVQLFDSMAISIHAGFIDKDLKLACFTDHQIFERYHRFQIKNSSYRKTEAITLKEIKNLNPGDFVTHIDHGIGRFGGLEKMEVNGKMQEAIRLVYKDNDILYVSIHSLHRIAKYSGKEGAIPKIDKIGSNAWQSLKQKTKKKVKEIAFDLIKLYAKRKAQKGFQFTPDNYLQNELEASFIYEDTPDQVKATNDFKKDMEAESPMDRLICGDVGFGKTEIAIRAAFKAVNDSKQVAVLVPTTILALQHYKTFSERLKELPCTVDYINRFKSAKQQKETLKKVEEGRVDILIGTHGIVGKNVKFKDLGLLIIDEEQKFGVGVKDKLKLLKANVDTLTLTATPIPRTLQFSMMGARDLSIINTPPPNRYPVHTELHSFNEEIIRDAIMYEVSRGGQVFFVHNRVQNITEVVALIERLCPNVKVTYGHGQMDGHQLEKVMLSFIECDYDVLVSTAIIESGLDISNANTIIVNDAHIFGLSDLHQLRGRVGRSNKKAFCYLLAPPSKVLTDEARKRLKAIEEFSDLGSGFQISMRDLDIRGAGNLLGAEQSGFISDIGYEMYQKILDEALDELREEFAVSHEQLAEKKSELQTSNFKPQTFVRDCNIDTDFEILIPDEYVSNITERLILYKELDESKTEEDLKKFQDNLRDRFGVLPPQTLELIDAVCLRLLAIEIGFEKLILKNNKLVGYFISNQKSLYYQSEAFSKVLQFVQKNHTKAKMKEGNNKLTLTFENIKNIADALKSLKLIVGEN